MSQQPGQTPARTRYLDLARRWLFVPLALLLASYVLLDQVGEHYPVEKWLFWVYARIWVWCLLFSVSCLSLGNWLLCRLMPSLPLRERIALALPLGCLGMYQLLFVGGLLSLYGQLFAVVAPLAVVAVGAPRLSRLLRSSLRHIGAARRGARGRPPWWWYPAVGLGLAGLGMVYFAILSPRNISFDANFYHLGLAQEYVLRGGIERFAEGWTPSAIPHLASVLYTWCFMLPGMDTMFLRVSCAAHLEFTIFLWTLAAIPVMVRWLVPGCRAGVSWVAVFLFPGILLYDSSLSGSADHITAFWAVPIYLALRRAYPRLAWRPMLLLSAMLAGALLTKYQGFYLLVYPAAAVALRTLWLSLRRRGVYASLRWHQPLVGLAVAFGAGVVLTAPHWLKNWVWYGDPLYPFMFDVFKPEGWGSEVGEIARAFAARQAHGWRPEGTTTAKLIATGKALLTFSFVPNNWGKLHGVVPVFGSLFTLSLLVLPVLRRTKRIWGVMAAAHIGVFCWYWTLHQDRYLQIILPWMVVAVAGTIALVWRTSGLARAALVGLVSLQVVWGGDVYFIPTHSMTHSSPVRVTSDLLIGGYKRNYDARFDLTTLAYKISKGVPEGARVLMHEHNPRLGLWRTAVTDTLGLQYGIRYAEMSSSAELHETLLRYGITHIMARKNKSGRPTSLAADLRFFDYVNNEAKVIHGSGAWSVFELPKATPNRKRNDMVLYLACGRFYERGLHGLEDMSVLERQPRTIFVKQKPLEALEESEQGQLRLAAKADYLVTAPGCKQEVAESVMKQFQLLASRAPEKIHVRIAK